MRRARLVILEIAVFAALAVWPPVALPPSALAQDAPGREATSANRDEKARELDALREDRRRADEAEARIRAEIDAIRNDRRALTQTLIDTAARVRAVEGKIASSEARLPLLDNEAARIRAALEGRRRLLADLLAVLQRMGRGAAAGADRPAGGRAGGGA